MIGVLVNVVAVLIGGLIGTICKKGISERLSQGIMTGVALCVVYVGIDGALKSQNTVILVIGMAIGTLIGAVLDIDGKINRLGDWLSAKMQGGRWRFSNVGEGFVAGTLLFCVGAMTIVGSINAGISGDNQMLFTKAALDFISALAMSVSLGIGVAFAAVSILVSQGGMVLLAQLLQPILTEYAIAQMTGIGSLLIIALGLNMLGITKIKVADMLPAIILAPLLCLFIK